MTTYNDSWGVIFENTKKLAVAELHRRAGNLTMAEAADFPDRSILLLLRKSYNEQIEWCAILGIDVEKELSDKGYLL